MAQLGDLGRARALRRRAARAFGPNEAVARARCVVAAAEIALVSRDLGWRATALAAARATLDEHGDRLDAAYPRYLEIRRLLPTGRIDEAERFITDHQDRRRAPGTAARAGCGESLRERETFRSGSRCRPAAPSRGLVSGGGDHFFCGGGRSGTVRTVRRPERRSATGTEALAPAPVAFAD
jgi:hypothetical protein